MKKIRNFLIVIIAIGYIIFEKFFWDKLAVPVINYLKEKDYYNQMMNYILSLNRYFILIIFLFFFIISELMGLYSLTLIANGMLYFGVLIYIIKFLPVLIAFGLLDKAKDKLYTFNWFKVTHIFISNKIDAMKRTRMYRKIIFLYKSTLHSLPKILIYIKNQRFF